MAGASAAQLGTQSIGQSIGYAISAQTASDDWDRWKKSLLRGPKYRMLGLERAGLNPILAVQGGLGVGAPSVQPLGGRGGGGGSPGGTNPEVAHSQANLARAVTAKEALNAETVAANLVVTIGQADCFKTPEYKSLNRMLTY